MGEYGTIRELVIAACTNEGVFPSYEKLTALVMKSFPTSKWKQSHYAWYKSKIKSGEFSVPGFDMDTQEIDTLNDGENKIQETIDASLSFERDLHSYFASRVAEIERGLVLVEEGVEYQTEAGRIDILAQDTHGNNVVIEFKAGTAKDSALGQLLGYMGCLASRSSVPVQIRGILVASDFEPRVVYAAKGLPHVKLLKYRVSFQVQEII